MSDFEKRVTRARRQSMRKWARALHFLGDIGWFITGTMGLWLFVSVVLA